MSAWTTNPTDVVRLELRGLYRGAIAIQHVFHLGNAEGTDVPDPATVAAYWRDQVVNSATFRVKFSQGMVWRQILCNAVVPVLGPQSSVSFSIAGTATGNDWPSVIAHVTTWRTAYPGRNRRGRTFWGGISSSGTSGQMNADACTFSTTTLANWAAHNAALIALFDGSSTPPHHLEMCIVSRVLGGQTPPYDPAGVFSIQGNTEQQYIATMGTRRYGRGI